ncbi:hypothetical protein OZ690_004288 [Yersinia enterocolitica]
MNTIEMHGLITGKCVAGDMKVNESVAEYLVRKIANIEDQRNAALNTCTLIGEALGIKGAVAGDTIAKVHRLVGENAALTDKAASELSNAWLLHKYWVGIQAALMHMRVGRINEATEWLIGTVSGPGIEAPNLKLTDEIEDWAEIQQKDTISHAQALEIIKAEMSATTQALNEYIARSIVAPDGYQLCFVPLEQTTAFRDACTTAYEESLSGTGPCGIFMAGYRSMLAAAPKIAASLRG